jgi:hypothetical protein
MLRIGIFVEGGVVQEIYASQEAKILLVDNDGDADTQQIRRIFNQGVANAKALDDEFGQPVTCDHCDTTKLGGAAYVLYNPNGLSLCAECKAVEAKEGAEDEEAARQKLLDIVEIMYPGGDKGHEWTPDTLNQIAGVINRRSR